MTEEHRYPELSPELTSKRFVDFLKFFGPGAIIASVTIGSGETVWASRSGAIFGTAMFWAFSLFTLTKIVQVYSAARYMTLTGEHPMARWAYLPGPRGLFPAIVGIVMVVSFPFYLSSLPIMLGTISSWILFGDSAAHPHLISLFFIAGLIALTLLQSYGLLEKVQISLVCAMLLVMLVATVAASPDWGAVAYGAVVPTMPEYPDWVRANPLFADRTLIVEMVAYMGVIGGGVQDYVGYVGMLREKTWGLIGRLARRGDAEAPVSVAQDRENLTLGKAWLRAPLTDTMVSFASVLLFTAAFLILGASLLHPNEIVPSGMDLYNHQVVFLTDLHESSTVKSMLATLYKAGVFFAIFGTVYGAYELYVRTAHESLCAITPKWRTLELETVRKWTLTYTAIAGSALVLVAWWTATQDPNGIGWNPISIMTIPLHVTGVFLAGPWCFAMVYIDRDLPAQLRMGKSLVVLNVICGLLFTYFGALAVYEDILALMK